MIAPPQPPDPAPGFVAVGMIPRHFIVGDDLIVPIDDVEASIRSEMDRDGTKPFIAGSHQVGQFPQPVTGAVALNPDGVDPARDRVGDIHDVGIRLGPGPVRQGKSA